MSTDRKALLVRCTLEEAKAIRNAAKREHRTISGYILHAVMGRIGHQEKMRQLFEQQVADKSRKSEPKP